MIQEKIMAELQYIPEPKLMELYDLIHYFRLGLNSEKGNLNSVVDCDMAASLQNYASDYIPTDLVK